MAVRFLIVVGPQNLLRCKVSNFQQAQLDDADVIVMRAAATQLRYVMDKLVTVQLHAGKQMHGICI